MKIKGYLKYGPLTLTIFENYIVSEVLKKERHANKTSDFYYLRTSHGVEVDLIIDRKNRKEFIGIKNSSTFSPKMVAPMSEFIEKGDIGFLIYRGENFPYYEPIKVLNYKNYLNMQFNF